MSETGIPELDRLRRRMRLQTVAFVASVMVALGFAVGGYLWSSWLDSQQLEVTRAEQRNVEEHRDRNEAAHFYQCVDLREIVESINRLTSSGDLTVPVCEYVDPHTGRVADPPPRP